MSTANDVLDLLSRLAPSGATGSDDVVWDVRRNGPVVASVDGLDEAAVSSFEGTPGGVPAGLDALVEGDAGEPPGVRAWRTAVRAGPRGRGRVARLSVIGTGVVNGRQQALVMPLVSARTGDSPMRFQLHGGYVLPVAGQSLPPQAPGAMEVAPGVRQLGLPEEALLRAARITPKDGVYTRDMLRIMERLRAAVGALDGIGIVVEEVVVAAPSSVPVDGPLRLVVGDLLYIDPGGHAGEPLWDVREFGPYASAQGTDLTAVTTRRRVDSPHDRAMAAWEKTVALHAEEGIGRISALALVGRGTVGDSTRNVVAPLMAAEFRTGLLGRSVYGELAITDVATCLGLDEHLLGRAMYPVVHRTGRIDPVEIDGLPEVRRLLEELADAGTHVDEVAIGPVAPLLDDDRLWLCIGELRYVEHAAPAAPPAARLRAWEGVDVSSTAFASLYGLGPPSAGDAGPTAELRSPLPLTASQRAAVRTARTAPISVVSGAPGTGKSHTAVAIALDELARGGSVLLAARSAHAADVLTELLERHPGPPPLQFGGSTSRRELADTLADGLPDAPDRDALRAVDEAEDAAADALRDAREVLAAMLEIAGADGGRATEVVLRTDVPGAFDGSLDRAEALSLLARASTDAGLFGAWRARRAARALRAALGAGPSVPLERIGDALGRARVRALAAALDDAGGLDMSEARAAVADAEAALRRAAGERLDVRTTGAPTRRARGAVAALGAALRAGPSRRAELLGRIDPDALTEALPLWVGTVAEVARLLPATPGLFDLVVLDESSQLDQLAAAPVLARARRAVVIGDPRQLRHVSFVADLDVDTALSASALPASLRPQLDVRRVSTFDAAAASAPVRWLDEHLRSVPHLIEFSAERFYGQHLHVTTAHPDVDSHDAIDTLHVEGREEDGVVRSEVDAVLAEIDRLAARGQEVTVGVVSPFRKQADALEEAIVERYDLDTILRLGLRVGTVHGFQGGERDHVLLSLGLTEDGAPQRRTFVQDPHLFNVMITRARQRVLVVTALPVGTGGLVGEYLDHAERPPAPPQPREPVDAWSRSLRDELARNGVAVEGTRSVGRHEVDLTVLVDGRVLGVLTRPHADGLDADVERLTALRRAGWEVVEVYRTPTDDDVVRRALELRHRFS